jgi:uncharacterized protein
VLSPRRGGRTIGHVASSHVEETEVTSYVPGQVCWAELSAPDPAAAARFYSEVFGWTAEVAPEPEVGGYTTFHHDGQSVAAVGAPMSEGQPTAWLAYVASDDVDATAATATEAGGTVLAGPFDVMEFGRMVVLADPGGAVIAAWQAGTTPGADLTEATGAVSWCELTTRDWDGARDFYPQVFGWTPREVDFGDAAYTIWERDGRSVAGMIRMDGEDWPEDLPNHWMLYVEVEDTDAVAARVTDAGGQVSVPPTDTPAGRFAVINDPAGAVLSVIRSDPAFAP